MPQFTYSTSANLYGFGSEHVAETESRGRASMIRSSSSLRLHQVTAQCDPSASRRSSSSSLGRRSDVVANTTSAYAWPLSRSSSRSSGKSIDFSSAAGEDLMSGLSLARPVVSRSSSSSSTRLPVFERRTSYNSLELEERAHMYTLTNWTASAEDLSPCRDRWTYHTASLGSGENHLSFLIPRCLPRKPAPAAIAGSFEAQSGRTKRIERQSRSTSPRLPQLLAASGSTNTPTSTWASIAGRGVQSTGQTIRTYSTNNSQNPQQNQRKHEQSPSNGHHLESKDNESPGEEGAKRRKTEHTPRTGVEETEIYVLSLWLGRNLQETMDSIRRKYYPPARQRVPSHISFFRALPGSKLEEMEKDIDQVCRNQSNQGVSIGRVDQRNNGVFVLMDRNSEKACQDMRSALLSKWKDFLSEQDNETRWRGHWTVINKADKSKEAAHRADECEQELKKIHGMKDKLEGLMMWKFEEHGTWTPYKQFRLGSGEVKDGDAKVAEKNHQRDEAVHS